MEYEDMIRCALEEGFAAAEIMDTQDITFDPSFRSYCAENLCGQYTANYSCPPDCGSPEAMQAKILAHKKALVLQTLWEISDYSDRNRINPAKAAHNASQIRLAKRFQDEGCSGFPVGASGCSLCSPCRRTLNQPCPFPEDRHSCMSAYCIFVKKLAEKCGMAYSCRDGLLAFFGMYVFG